MNDVVISYAREDREMAATLCNQLSAEGIESKLAPRLTSLDEGFIADVIRMIAIAKVLIVVFSEDSNRSGQVIREVELAKQNEVEILIVQLDDTKPTGSLGYYLSGKQNFSMKKKEVEPWETASQIRDYLAQGESENEVTPAKMQAALNELKNRPEEVAPSVNRKTTTAVLAMIAIPLVFIIFIWLLLLRFDFIGKPSDQEYEAARKHIIYVQDTTLEEAIRSTLTDQGIELSASLKEADLWELTSLKVISPDEKERIDEAILSESNLRMAENGLIEIDGVIESLEGLEYAKNLKELIVAGQSIQDLEPIANLTDLFFLNLSSNRISDMEELKNLSQIKVLILSDNAIRDVGVLEYLDQVTELNLQNNEIIDITSMENMKKIKRVNLSNNKIHNIRSIGTLESLEEIILASNQINDVSDLRDLKRLTLLDIRDNQVISINDLSSLTELKWLYLGDNRVRDLSVAKEFEYLVGLKIENNPIQNIGSLEELKESLKMLWIDQDTYEANSELMEQLEEAEILIYVVD